MLSFFENSTILWGLDQVVNYGASKTSLHLLTAASVALIVMKMSFFIQEMRRLPPGPWSLPIVGYLPFLGVRHKTFLSLAKYYGALFSARIGNKLTIVISNHKLIRDTFRREEFTGRPNTPLMHTLDGLGE